MGDIHPLASVRVLTNADLLHGIFTFVPRASEKRDSHLARCATVCRAFHEPTIRVLWRDLDSLLPLWHLLAPPNTLFPSDDAVEEQIQHFLEEVASAQLYLDPTRWDRFLRHAAHIRVICHRTRASPAIETANRLLIQAVIMQNAGRTVLPLLRSIHWQSCDSPWDGALIPLFTPTLRHAGFTTNSGDGPSAHLLRRLREACPTLHSIYLNYISPSLVQGVLPFDRLRKVGIYRISGPDHFRDIITKPDLTTLRVHDVVGPWATPGPIVSVSDLRVLAVTGTAPGLMGLFTCARFHALESAHIHVTSSKEVHLRSGDITALLGLFYAAVSASHVRTLNLTMICISLQSDDDFPPLRDLLASILPLRDLRTFTLTGVLRVMPVDDADFVALARAWPTLERLNISDGTTSESAVSLGALHHFASACPSLQELSLPGLVYPVVGVHVIPEPPLASSPERPPHPLRQLRVRTVLVPKTDPQSISDESAEAFARYLLELFPNLDGWEYMPKPPRPREPSPEPGPPGRRRPGISMSSFVAYDGRWWAVARRIYALCAAREEAKLSFSA